MNADKFNPIKFRTEVLPSKMLMRDDSGEFAVTEVPLEFRFDPLTGRTCRVVRFSLDRIIRPDIETLVQRSREMPCPFCQPLVEQITPRFPPDVIPEGVIRRGKALVFPNTSPWDVYGVVVVISDEHFIPLDGFDTETVLNAMLAAQEYIRVVEKADPAAKYHFIAWNYMPPSGGSLVHPHLQSNAGPYPTDYQKDILDASERYYREKETNYWSDLLKQEKQMGERYVARIGSTEWLTAFTPVGRLSDVICLFPGRASVAELAEEELRDFSEGMLKVFGYVDGLNLTSFNMATYSGFDANSFWAHARITPRGSLLYSPIETSDQFYYQVLHNENICILSPEIARERLFKFFNH